MALCAFTIGITSMIKGRLAHRSSQPAAVRSAPGARSRLLSEAICALSLSRVEEKNAPAWRLRGRVGTDRCTVREVKHAARDSQSISLPADSRLTWLTRLGNQRDPFASTCDQAALSDLNPGRPTTRGASDFGNLPGFPGFIVAGQSHASKTGEASQRVSPMQPGSDR